MKNSTARISVFLIVPILVSILVSQANYPAAAAPPFDLSNGLLAYWKLDEDAGSSRADSVGTHTLSELVLSVPRVTGKLTYAAAISDPTTILSSPDAAD